MKLREFFTPPRINILPHGFQFFPIHIGRVRNIFHTTYLIFDYISGILNADEIYRYSFPCKYRLV